MSQTSDLHAIWTKNASMFRPTLSFSYLFFSVDLVWSLTKKLKSKKNNSVKNNNAKRKRINNIAQVTLDFLYVVCRFKDCWCCCSRYYCCCVHITQRLSVFRVSLRSSFATCRQTGGTIQSKNGTGLARSA